MHQVANAHAHQPQALVELDALQAQADGAADVGGRRDRPREGLVAGHGHKAFEAQFEAHRLAGVALAGEVLGQALAELIQDLAEPGLVVHRVQVALEGGLAADRHRLTVRDDGAVVPAMRGRMQPLAVALTKLFDQPAGVGRRNVAHGLQAELDELVAGLGADAVDLAHRQRPDARGDVGQRQHRDAVGLVQFAGDLAEQLVGRDADGAGQAGRPRDRVLDLARHGFHAAERVVADRVAHTGHVAQVDVDLVDAAVLDDRRDLGDRGLEQARVVAVAVEVGRQQDGIGGAQRGLHQAHGREHAEVARGVGGGRHHAAAGVVAQPGVFPAPILELLRSVGPPSADHHRFALELRIAQQLDGRVESVHVEVGDPAVGWQHGGGIVPRRADRRRQQQMSSCISTMGQRHGT
mmetsp:Transcript_6770/g.28501  ORF Transcript_6770/g.28501 Transcript_6770/m.28501 type:complete len:408 (+) Transcript_6770:2174-3397(+)